jgi:hypothetical protein
MKRSVRFGCFVIALCVSLLVLLDPTVTFAAPHDTAPVSEPTPTSEATPAVAPETVSVAAPEAAPSAAPAPAKRDAFSSGTKRLSVVVGNGYAFDNSYLLIGVGAGYFIANGLDLGLDFEWWTGSSPGITKISPRFDYVFNTGGALRPYAGVFYRRTMIEGLDDLNSIGGRVGLYFMSGKGVYVGAGVVYESYLSCDTATYSSCSDTYPEIVVAFSF